MVWFFLVAWKKRALACFWIEFFEWVITTTTFNLSRYLPFDSLQYFILKGEWEYGLFAIKFSQRTDLWKFPSESVHSAWIRTAQNMDMNIVFWSTPSPSAARYSAWQPDPSEIQVSKYLQCVFYICTYIHGLYVNNHLLQTYRKKQS